MELKQLRYAVAVAEERHFGRAARREHTSQSVISHHIHQLEKELDAPLFERSSRYLQLTDAGRAFVVEARRILRRLDGAAGLVQRAADPLAEELRVGFLGSGVERMTQPIVAEFRRRMPHVRLSFHDAGLTDRSCGLVDSRSDVTLTQVFSSTPPAYPHLVLFSEPCWLLVPEGHRFAQLESVPYHQVDHAELVLAADSSFLAHQRRASFRGTAATVEELYEYAALGGVTYAGPSTIRRYSRAGVTARPLLDGPTVDHVLVWKDNGRAVVEEFVEAAHEVTAAEPAQPS